MFVGWREGIRVGVSVGGVEMVREGEGIGEGVEVKMDKDVRETCVGVTATVV